MRILKNNFYDILRLYINQIGITIFSLVLYTAINMVDDEKLNIGIKVAISVFACLFYFVLLYTASWDYGGKDKIRIDAGRLEENKFKGIVMALWANVPNFFLAGICAISYLLNMSFEIGFFEVLSNLFNLFVRFTMAMYLGVLQGIFNFLKNDTALYYFWQSVGYVIMPLFAVLATHVGYIFGLRNKKIFRSAKADEKLRK